MEHYTKAAQLENMIRDCPDLLTIREALSWSPFGKNQLYKLIKEKQLQAHYVQGSYMIAKSELIDYLLKHCDDDSHLHMFKSKSGGEEDD